MATPTLAVVLGNQLFPDHAPLHPTADTHFFMAEDVGLCTHFRYHKHKLMLFLSAMRSHADELRKQHEVTYWTLTADNRHLSYEEKLRQTLADLHVRRVVTYEPEDKFFARRLRQFAREEDVEIEFVEAQGFLTTRGQFREYLDGEHRQTRMQYFYQWQRRRLGVLIDAAGKPEGGKWSYDAENRKALPKQIDIPTVADPTPTEHTQAVSALVDELFADHPGRSDQFRWATTRRAALYRVREFLDERFDRFGPYEDAIDRERVHLFHSALSPYINLGLITPDEVLERALAHADAHDVPLNSLEGYVRQLIGWREFMRGMYHTHDLEKNYFDFTRRLTDHWYDATTGLLPLDAAIRRVDEWGWTHHIERLMVLGNLMLLCEVSPDEVYRWFMEMFVDSSDWVMVPNVYAMSQFADGGTFTTKPYVGGGNYLRKMSNYAKGDGRWQETVNGLYWRFVDRQRETFAANPRMAVMPRNLDRMDGERRARLFALADAFVERVTKQ
ncbi:MAG: cryptochrome/photolyase family protein [Catalinimonas sp.]